MQILYVENRAEKIELLAGLTLGTEGAPPLPVINKVFTKACLYVFFLVSPLRLLFNS